MNNTKMKNAWEWIKEHKLQIGIAAATMVGGVALYKATKSLPKAIEAVQKTVPDVKPEYILPDIGIGTVEEYATYADGTALEFWMDDIPLSAMGELGEKIMANSPDPIPENATVWAILNIRQGEAET